MKCLFRCFCRISIGIFILLPSHSHGASAGDFMTIDNLLRDAPRRRVIANSLRGVWPSTSKVYPFSDPKLNLDTLKTILSNPEAIRYQSVVWPNIVSQGSITTEVLADQTLVYIAFDSSNEAKYRTLDPEQTWCPRGGTHCSLASTRLLAEFFAGAPGDPTQYKLNYSHTVLALYLQRAIWDIIIPLTVAKDTRYNFVLTGHGSGGVTAQIFSLLLFQKIRELDINGKVNVIASGPRPFKYNAATYVRRIIPGMRVFTTREKGTSDSFTFYPDTYFSGSTDIVGLFDWDTDDESHSFARSNNAWTHAVNVTLLPAALTHADGIRGKKLGHADVYANALINYAPEAIPAGDIKAPSLAASLSPCAAAAAAAAVGDLAPGAEPPAAGGAGGKDGGAEDAGGWGYGFPSWLSLAPAPASAPEPSPGLPPYPPAALGDTGSGGGVAAAAAAVAASGASVNTGSSWWRDYVPDGLSKGLAAATGAVADGLTAAVDIGSIALTEALRTGGKILLSRELADQTLTFESRQAIFHNALAHNEDAFRILHGFADKDPIAKGYAAILLAFGFGTPVNLPLARRYADEVAAEIEGPAFYDVPDAQILYALMLQTGLGTAKKHPVAHTRRAKARELYTRVLPAKSSEAYYRLGELARAEGDVEEAKKLLTIASGTYSHPFAMNSLGEIYYSAGKTDEALKRFNLADTNGNLAVAKYNLGRAYYEQKIAGLSPEEQRAQAKSHLRKAVAQGHCSAQVLLGLIAYEEGDYPTASKLFLQATAISSDPAASDLANVFKPTETAAAEAHLNLHLMYRTGHGTADKNPDLLKAQEHLSQAETLRNADALTLSLTDTTPSTLAQKADIFYRIAMMYYTGIKAPLDLASANIFFSNAANPTSSIVKVRTPPSLTAAKASFAAAVVRLEMLGTAASTTCVAGGGAGTVASPKLGGGAAGGAGRSTAAAVAAKALSAPVSMPMALFTAALATPPSGAALAASRTTAASKEFEIPLDIQSLLQDAMEGGCGEADTLLKRLKSEGVMPVATSICAKRKRGPGEILSIDPFAAAAP